MLSDIDTALLQKYVANRGKEVKPKTVINEIVPIKLMFKHACRCGYLKRNPAEYLERPKVEKEEMQILTPEEIRLFLNNVNPSYKIFFLTAILAGMRRGELIGLQWGDIDWNHNQIHVRCAFRNTSKELQSPKTRNAKRKIDMSPTLIYELKKHKLASRGNDLDLVFSNSEAILICADNMVKRQFPPTLRRAKIRDVSLHSFRYTNVTFHGK